MLMVEDQEPDARLLGELGRGGFDVTYERVDTAEAMANALARQDWDVVLSDYSMPRFDAPRALALLHERKLDLPFIVVSGTSGEEAVVAAMKAGAHDFFRKDKLGPWLAVAIERERGEASRRRKGREKTRALELAMSIEREHREALHRRKARETTRVLEDTENRLEVLLQASRFVLYLCDAHGDIKVHWISPNVEDLVGHPPEAFYVDHFWQEGVHPDDLARVLTDMERSATEDRIAVEYRFRHRDGSWRVMHDEFWVQRDEAGAPAFLLGGWADITEQKKLQEQLMISDRMASMGTLAAGVAHEINNPLACVIANLELAERDLGERAESLHLEAELQEIREEAHDARKAAERIRDIVRDLKIFSRSKDEATGPVDVQRVMESTLRMAWNEIRHRARLVKDYGKTPPVEATESRLGQVFLNLVINAAQAISEGRAKDNEIRVATSVAPGGLVVVEIADTGPGMSPEVMGRLFTPFFTTKPIGVGTGLGLSICHRIVTGFGGSIEVESALGKGTTFRISLPAAPGAATEAAPEVALGTVARRRGRILVVDDEPLLIRVVERTLAVEHDVVALSNAREALDRILAGERFDVILCDLMMPQMTGMDLHAELFRLVREQAERMIFLSGGAFTERARAFLAEIPNPCIDKPFNAREMKALLNDRIR